MKHNIFAEIVKRYFHYLITDYGFRIVEERYDPESFGNSLVVFQLNLTFISLSLDKGDVYLDIGSVSNPKNTYNLGTVIEFLRPQEHQRIKVFGFSKLPDDPYERMEIPIRYWAELLHQYCQPILRGDFAQWKELEVHQKRSVEEFTKNELPKVLARMKQQEQNERLNGT